MERPSNLIWFVITIIKLIMDSKEKSSGNVMVVCRARPLNNKEIEKGAKCCLEFHKDKKNIAINMASETSAAFGANRFIFDHIFDMKST